MCSLLQATIDVDIEAFYFSCIAYDIHSCLARACKILNTWKHNLQAYFRRHDSLVLSAFCLLLIRKTPNGWCLIRRLDHINIARFHAAARSKERKKLWIPIHNRNANVCETKWIESWSKRERTLNASVCFHFPMTRQSVSVYRSPETVPWEYFQSIRTLNIIESDRIVFASVWLCRNYEAVE